LNKKLLSIINNNYTNVFKFFEHVQPVQEADFYVFHFDHVLYNQMYSYVHLHIDAMNKIDHHNDNQNLNIDLIKQNFIQMNCFLPVNPSFLLQVSQVHRLRFFFSGLDELIGEAPR